MLNDSLNSHHPKFDEEQALAHATRHPKLRGEIAEMAFLLKTARLGLCVSKPYGDSYAYDFIVDTGTRLWRVQVKSTHQPRGKGTASPSNTSPKDRRTTRPTKSTCWSDTSSPPTPGTYSRSPHFYPAANSASTPTEAAAAAVASRTTKKPGTC